MSKSDALIDELARSAEPVRPISTRLGRAALTAVAALTLLGTFALVGIRADVARLSPEPVVALSGGLMFLLAIAAGTAAVRMARPQVGAPSTGAPWALAALLLLPAVALAGIADEPSQLSALTAGEGFRCLAIGLAAGIATIVYLTLWQRRGATVRPEAAGWLAGLAGGAVGALAVTLQCPADSLAHIGIWHVAAVPVAALAARLLLPPFLRW